MSLVQYLLKGSNCEALHCLISLAPSLSDNASKDRVHTYDEVMHYLMHTYATDKNISLAIVDRNGLRKHPARPVPWPAGSFTGMTIYSAYPSPA